MTRPPRRLARARRSPRALAPALAVGAWLALVPSLAHAAAFPDATALAEESVASTDDVRALLVNPAALGQRYPSELLLAYARRDRGHEWGAALAGWRRIAFGLTRERDSTYAWSLGFSAGDDRVRWGWSPMLRVASAPASERAFDDRAGIMIRTLPWLAVGFTAGHLFQSEFHGRRLEREYTWGVGLRPLAWWRNLAHDAGTRFTLTADAALREGDSPREAAVRVGVAVEPIPGVELRALAQGHGAFQVGASLRGVRRSVQAAQARTRNDRVFETVAVSLHSGEDRTLAPPRLMQRVARVRIGGVLADEALSGGLQGGGGGRPSADLHRQLERALEDPLTRGVFLELDHSAGMAQLEELRPRIERLERAGKPVVAYLDEGGSRGDLYLASAAGLVVASPAAEFLGLGLRTERRYYRRLLERLGVRLDRSSIGDYKSAWRNYSVDSTPPADSAVINRLLDQRQELFVATVTRGRGIPRERLLPVLDGRAHPASTLASLGVIDSVGWREQALAELGRRTGLGRKPRTVDLRRAPRAHTAWHTPARIAVIYAGGTIVSGRSGGDLWEGAVLGDETFAAQLERALEAPDIRAVVVRVESPGGQSSASHRMDHTLERLKRENRKPIVVSMGSIATSGAYFLSAHADKIFANRHTVTGSIGVVFVKPSIEGLYRKAGVRQEEFDRGTYMRGLSLGRDWDAREQAAADSAIARHYETFVGRVAAGRGLEPAEAEAHARGRAWLADDARERGLVDEIGGLEAAIAEARRLGGVPAGEKIAPRELRRPRGALFERLLGGWLRERVAATLRWPERTGVEARADDWVEDLD
jgi:protease-4